jgi:hypothetical protein
MLLYFSIISTIVSTLGFHLFTPPQLSSLLYTSSPIRKQVAPLLLSRQGKGKTKGKGKGKGKGTEEFPNESPIDDEIFSIDAELIQQQKEQEEEREEMLNWLPDREKARIIQENKWKPASASVSQVDNDLLDTKEQRWDASSTQKQPNQNMDESYQTQKKGKKKSTYNDEEEELIEILGGKYFDAPSPKRESGFLGDCTLKEIALDYQVPICYLADVLCSWGVPPPIDPDGLLGDMVTGEQAFAILEAIHTLDMGALYDRYSNYDLVTLCNEYEIHLPDAFEMAMKEGWNLPFGVRTYLRVEQEERLLEVLAKEMW